MICKEHYLPKKFKFSLFLELELVNKPALLRISGVILFGIKKRSSTFFRKQKWSHIDSSEVPALHFLMKTINAHNCVLDFFQPIWDGCSISTFAPIRFLTTPQAPCCAALHFDGMYCHSKRHETNREEEHQNAEHEVKERVVSWQCQKGRGRKFKCNNNNFVT